MAAAPPAQSTKRDKGKPFLHEDAILRELQMQVNWGEKWGFMMDLYNDQVPFIVSVFCFFVFVLVNIPGTCSRSLQFDTTRPAGFKRNEQTTVDFQLTHSTRPPRKRINLRFLGSKFGRIEKQTKVISGRNEVLLLANTSASSTTAGRRWTIRQIYISTHAQQ
jgi:hypothetical protein